MTEAQRTEQAVMAVIILLLVVAALLTLLTIWYWRHTSPKRQVERVRSSVDLDNYGVELTGPPTEVYQVTPGEQPMEARPRNLR